MAFGRPEPSFEWMRFDVEVDYEDYDKTAATRAALDATDPDLSRFKALGGKILSYFGWADPALNPMMGVSYYERVVETMGPATKDFYRLFMVPGMFHCTGGIGTSTFDPVTPLIQWVEKGVAPASHSRRKGRERQTSANPSSLSLPGGRQVQGFWQHRRSRELCVCETVAKMSRTIDVQAVRDRLAATRDPITVTPASSQMS